MQVVRRRTSLWIYFLLLTFLQLWGRLSSSSSSSISSTSSPTLPAPSLGISSRSGASVVLTCQVPRGYNGVLFMLYRFTDKVNSREVQSGAEEVHFTVEVKESHLKELYCCLYKDSEGLFSAFSPYLPLEHQKAAVPTQSPPLFPPPVKDTPPRPTLVLYQQTDVWHLLCVGSAAYPGAVFSLCLADTELPIDTVRAKITQHQATFPVPVQDAAVVLYQCRYSVFLEKTWSRSEHSRPIAITREGSPPPPPPASGLPGVDWPLVLGCFSAVVLFLCSVALAVVVTHRKVKAAAEQKKNRQDAQFWTQVHAKDHVVDLTLRRSSFSSQDWPRGGTEMTSTHSSFTTPGY